MFSQATRLLGVCVIVCVEHLTPTLSQCTTKCCCDDNGALTAMVSRLHNSLKELEKQHQYSIEQLQQNFNDVEQQRSKHQESVSQLNQQFKESMEQQNEYVNKLRNTMKENIFTIEKDLRDKTSACTSATTSATTGNPSATDCAELKREGYSESGVYNIRLVEASKTIKVYCDMTTDGGGWLVFQRRQDGTFNFYRDWATYKEGFGDLSGEFWLGNDYLHDMTSRARYTLRIDMEDFENATRYAVYSNFSVASEGDMYRLSLGAYTGTAGDSFTYQDGMAFSTTDRDNDVYSGQCAQLYNGGWWYTNCGLARLNDPYYGRAHNATRGGIVWYDWRGFKYSLKKVEMKLRP